MRSTTPLKISAKKSTATLHCNTFTRKMGIRCFSWLARRTIYMNDCSSIGSCTRLVSICCRPLTLNPYVPRGSPARVENKKNLPCITVGNLKLNHPLFKYWLRRLFPCCTLTALLCVRGDILVPQTMGLHSGMTRWNHTMEFPQTLLMVYFNSLGLKDAAAPSRQLWVALEEPCNHAFPGPFSTSHGVARLSKQIVRTASTSSNLFKPDGNVQPENSVYHRVLLFSLCGVSSRFFIAR